MKTLVLLMLVLFATISHAQPQWIQCGPIGHRVMAVTIMDKILFAGTDGKGLYRSLDNGFNWAVVPITGIDNPTVSSLAPSDSVLFAAIQGAVCVSTDHGVSWTKLDSTMKDIAVKSIMVKGSLLFAGTVDQGVYRSSDMGKSWMQIRDGLGSMNIECLAAIGEKIYVGTTGGLYGSANDGNNWMQTGNSLSGKVVTCIAGEGATLFAGTQNSGVFRSKDNGLTWASVNSGMTSQQIVTLGFNKMYVLAGTATNMYVSTNTGDNWTMTKPNTQDRHSNSIYMTDSIILSGNEGMVYKSKGDYIFWNNSDRRFRSHYDSVCSILASKKGNLFAGTYSGGILRSTDDGENWFTLHPGIHIDTVMFFAQMDENVIAGTYGGKLIKSADEGKSWASLNKGLEFKSLRIMKVVGSSLFISVDSVGIFRSLDKGESWQLLDSVFRNQFIVGFAVIGKNLFAATFTNGIYRSTDNGDTWRQMISGAETEFVLALSAHNNILFAGQYQNGILRSTNNGETWTKITGTGGFGLSFGEYEDKVFFGCSQGVFQSRDNGDNWNYLGIDDGYIYGFAINETNLFAASLGKGIWKRDLSTLSVHENHKDLMSESALVCYPNPANNTLTIDRTTLHFPENTPIHYTLSTLVGGKVMEFDNSEPKFTVQLEGMASGVYSLSAESGANRAAVMVTVVE